MKKNAEDHCRNCSRDRSLHQDLRCPIRNDSDGTVYSSWMKFNNRVTPTEWVEESRCDDLVFGTAENALRKSNREVINPDHYIADRTIQPWHAISDWKLDFALGNVVKYVARAGRKGNGDPDLGRRKMIDDLKKAQNYLEFKIRELEKESF